MLPQVRHIIVNMLSSILIVTVNAAQTVDVLDLKVKYRSFFPKRQEKTYQLKKFRNHKLCRNVRQTIKNREFS